MLSSEFRATVERMKIATYNVNGINGRLPVLLRWLEQAEARCRLPAGAEGAAREVPGAGDRARRATARSGTARRAGTASPSWRAGAKPVETRRGLPGDPDDIHSRYIEAAVDGDPDRLPLSAQRQSGARPEVRLQAELVRAADPRTPPSCLQSTTPVVLAGDYNVMPTELDVYKPERWVDDALFRPEAREAYRKLVAQGWTDALRTLHPDERIYTFWDYFRNAYAAQRRPAHRPSAAEPGGRAASGRGRRRPRRARLGEDQRPRAGLDRAEGSGTATRLRKVRE